MEQSHAEDQRGDGYQHENCDPDAGRHPGQSAKLVGIRRAHLSMAPAAAALALQFDNGADPAKKQEPRRGVAESRLDRGRREPAHREDSAGCDEQGNDAVSVADRKERRGQQREQQP